MFGTHLGARVMSSSGKDKGASSSFRSAAFGGQGACVACADSVGEMATASASASASAAAVAPAAAVDTLREELEELLARKAQLEQSLSVCVCACVCVGEENVASG
jgi:hypothetical protein